MRDILECGISMWPKMDGRWPLTSGMKFKFDPEREVGQRILPESFLIADTDEPVDLDKEYILASKYYISTGKDGYSAFLGIKPLQDPAFTIQDIVKNWFRNF